MGTVWLLVSRDWKPLLHSISVAGGDRFFIAIMSRSEVSKMIRHSWIRRLFAATHSTVRKPARRPRLHVETFEDRVVPTILNLTGSATTVGGVAIGAPPAPN